MSLGRIVIRYITKLPLFSQVLQTIFALCWKQANWDIADEML